MKRYTFPKSEKLTSKKSIELLFRKSKSVFVYPFKIGYLPNRKEEEEIKNEKTAPKVLISVPKRSFKHAVDRNKIKRMIREVYRLQKPEWMEQSEILPESIGILYVGKKKEPYAFMERKMNKALANLSEALTTQFNNSRSNK